MIRGPIRDQQVRPDPGPTENGPHTEALRVPIPLPPHQRRRWLWPGLFGALLLALLLGVAIGKAAPCEELGRERQQVADLRAAGKYEQAVLAADFHLGKSNAWPSVCEPSKMDLATQRYRAAMTSLLAHQEEDGETAVLRWQEAERQALAYGVVVDPPIAVAGAAYRAGRWQLARAAFLRAWGVSPDPSAISLYYGTLVNWGDGLLLSGKPEPRALGLQVLRTACELSRSFGLAQREACQRLEGELPEAHWPPPLPDEVLASARNTRRT
jgi:hypothetical protein